jgi:glutathione S-transferase
MGAALRWRFIGTPLSYFSAKIRPLLRYKRIAYTEIDPDMSAYMSTIIPRTGVAFIPVVMTDRDEVLQDTPRIIDRIEQLVPAPAVIPADAVARTVAEIIQDFADEALILPAMHFRWSFPEQRAWIVRDWTRHMGPEAVKMTERMSGSLPMLGITDKTRAAIDGWYGHLLNLLDAHLAQHRFLLGDRLTLADLGMIGPFYPHLGRDPIPAARMRQRAPRVAAWVGDVNDAATPETDDFEPVVADSLAPLLREIATVFLPMQEVSHAFVTNALSDKADGEQIERALGMIDTPILGLTEKRMVNVYSSWRRERTARRYRALDGAERKRVDAALEPVGLLPYVVESSGARVAMDGFKLVVGEPGS